MDQIYPALRLAFVQCVSENGESVPMLLMIRSRIMTMRLSSTLSLLAIGIRQVLLFTCREDVDGVRIAVDPDNSAVGERSLCLFVFSLLE